MIIAVILTALVILGIFFIVTKKENFGSSSGGALIQLVAKDVQDSYLIGGPRPYYPYPPYYYPDYPYVI